MRSTNQFELALDLIRNGGLLSSICYSSIENTDVNSSIARDLKSARHSDQVKIVDDRQFVEGSDCKF
jgi:hypothetical protein